jgi:hypothetical protein
MFECGIIEALSLANPGKGMSSCHGTNSHRRSRSAESVFSATVTAERHGSRANVHTTELAGQHWPKVDGKGNALSRDRGTTNCSAGPRRIRDFRRPVPDKQALGASSLNARDTNHYTHGPVPKPTYTLIASGLHRQQRVQTVRKPGLRRLQQRDRWTVLVRRETRGLRTGPCSMLT